MSSRLWQYGMANGYGVTRDIRQADLVLINTCGFTLESQADSEACFCDALRYAAPDATICALGCMVRLKGKALAQQYPRIHMLERLSRLDEIIGAAKPFVTSTSQYYQRSLYEHVVRSNGRDAAKGLALASWAKKFGLKGALLTKVINEVLDDNKILIQIGTGCLNQCSYCSIRRAKGLPASRPIDEILAELKAVYRPGISVNLVCDDGGSYGHDIGTDFLTLLYAIDREYPGIPLEIFYVHPRWLVERETGYLKAFSELNIVTMNAPVQSGSDRVLCAMKRLYRIDDVLRALRRIKRISPGTLVWGEIMYGHPLERWRDLCGTVRAIWQYDHFLYSRMSPVNESDAGLCAKRNMIKLFFQEMLMKAAQHAVFFRLLWRDLLVCRYRSKVVRPSLT
jgi:tRNA A37 methylthiotransferase MiaB